MPATYRCGSCNATWAEDVEPTDCPRCGSPAIKEWAPAESSFESQYDPPAIRASGPLTSLSFTLTYWLGMAGGFASFLLIGAAGDENAPLSVAGGLALMASMASLIAACVISFVKIYRGWDLIQPLRRADWNEAGMPTPGMAVGLLFVPFYNLYWNFVALQGLASRANKFMTLAKIDGRPMGEGLAQTYCILYVCTVVPCVNILICPVMLVIYYLFILDVDRMRNTIQTATKEGLQAGQGDLGEVL
jgi:hypothetical protein